MSNCRIADYERVVSILRRGGATERELVRKSELRITRVREITTWLTEHDIVRGQNLGTRQDPRDSSRRIQIVRYSLSAPCPPEYLENRIRAHERAMMLKGQRRGAKVFDAAGLMACWGGVA